MKLIIREIISRLMGEKKWRAIARRGESDRNGLYKFPVSIKKSIQVSVVTPATPCLLKHPPPQRVTIAEFHLSPVNCISCSLLRRSARRCLQPPEKVTGPTPPRSPAQHRWPTAFISKWPPGVSST